MSEKRRREFAAGRACARQALERLGLPPCPVPVGGRRQPLWPAGVVGSISHTSDLCAVAATRRADVLGLGLDLEPYESLPEELQDLVCRPSERTWMEEQPAPTRGLLARTLFSAKETVFKCTFPRSGVWLEFEDVVIHFLDEAERFEARILKGGGDSGAPERVDGRIARGLGHVWTSAVWRRGDSPRQA